MNGALHIYMHNEIDLQVAGFLCYQHVFLPTGVNYAYILHGEILLMIYPLTFILLFSDQDVVSFFFFLLCRLKLNGNLRMQLK